MDHSDDPVIKSTSFHCMKCYGLASPAMFYCKLHDAALCAGCWEVQEASGVTDSPRCVICDLISSKGNSITLFRPVGRFPARIIEAEDNSQVDYINVLAYMNETSDIDHGDVAQAIVDDSGFDTACVVFCRNRSELFQGVVSSVKGSWCIIVVSDITDKRLADVQHALSAHGASEVQERHVLVLLPTEDVTPGEVASLNVFSAGLQITLTHAGYHRGSDRDFVSQFLDLYVRSRCSIYQALHRSLHPGRLEHTNVIIRCPSHRFTVCAYLPTRLWLGSKMCCVGATENTGNPGVVTCKICYSRTNGISGMDDQDRDPLSKIHLLTPQMLGSAITDPERRNESVSVPVGTWVSLPTDQFWELPTWELNTAPLANSKSSKRMVIMLTFYCTNF